MSLGLIHVMLRKSTISLTFQSQPDRWRFLSQHQGTSAKSHLCHSEGCERAALMSHKTAEVEVVQTSEIALLYPVC